MQDISYAIRIEQENARRVIRSLADDADDEQLVHDTVEGETNLMEAFDRAIERIIDLDAHVIGIEAQINVLKARAEKFEAGQDRIRKAIHEAMAASGLKRCERALKTLSLQKKPRAVIEYNLDLVPGQYWIPQSPKLDKKTAGADLKAGRTIPGLGLTDSSLTLHVR
jgi:hypothetical protein